MATRKLLRGLHWRAYPLETEDAAAPVSDATEQYAAEQEGEWAGRALVVSLSIAGIAAFALLALTTFADSPGLYRAAFDGLANENLRGLLQCPLH